MRAAPSPRERALSPTEEAQLIGLMMSTRFAHLSPKQLVPQLADRGLYLASESTYYRLQRRYGLRGTRRRIARTEIIRATRLHRADGPNQVWSWDITWLATTVRGLYLHLYLVLDVWSRRIVGWCIAERGSAEIAAEVYRDAAMAWCRTLLQSTARLGLQSVLRVSVPHTQTHAGLSATTLREPRRRAALDDALRRLVQRGASPQCDPVRDAERASLRSGKGGLGSTSASV